jgi:hypothetical protein
MKRNMSQDRLQVSPTKLPNFLKKKIEGVTHTNTKQSDYITYTISVARSRFLIIIIVIINKWARHRGRIYLPLRIFLST